MTSTRKSERWGFVREDDGGPVCAARSLSTPTVSFFHST